MSTRFPWCNSSGGANASNDPLPIPSAGSGGLDGGLDGGGLGGRDVVLFVTMSVIALLLAWRIAWICLLRRSRRRSRRPATRASAAAASKRPPRRSFLRTVLTFVFDYVVATVVGVCWESTFCLAFPSTCKALVPEILWAIVATLVFPTLAWTFKRNWGAARTPASHRAKGTNLLLAMTFGFSVATAYSTAIAGLATWLCLDQDNHLPTTLFMLVLAIAVTSVCVALQSCILQRSLRQEKLRSQQRRRHVDPGSRCRSAMRCRRACRESWLTSFYSVMLGSFWTTIGYCWNQCWTKLATYLYRAPPSAQSSMVQMMITLVLGVLGYLFVVHEPIIDKETLTGGGEGGDEIGTNGDGALKEETKRRARCERLLVASKMGIVVTISYAVNGMSYNFATKYLSDHGFSSALYYTMLYLWAVLLTAGTVALARCVGWDTGARDGTYTGRLKGFSVLCSSWVTSYAWWYPWSDNIDSITGFGIPSDGFGTSRAAEAGITLARIALAVGLGGVLSWLAGYTFVGLARRWGGVTLQQQGRANNRGPVQMSSQLSDPLLDGSDGSGSSSGSNVRDCEMMHGVAAGTGMGSGSGSGSGSGCGLLEEARACRLGSSSSASSTVSSAMSWSEEFNSEHGSSSLESVDSTDDFMALIMGHATLL